MHGQHIMPRAGAARREPEDLRILHNSGRAEKPRFAAIAAVPSAWTVNTGDSSSRSFPDAKANGSNGLETIAGPIFIRPALLRDQQKACPGLDPGWVPVLRAQSSLRRLRILICGSRANSLIWRMILSANRFPLRRIMR
jgi:hypothetical protein